MTILRPTLAGSVILVAALALTGCGAPPPAPSAAAALPAPTPAAGAPATPTEERVELRFTGGEAEGGLARVAVERGAQVVLVVTSDRPDEAHLHGYDRTVELRPGRPGELRFTADVPGVFEFELHDSGVQLARVEIR